MSEIANSNEPIATGISGQQEAKNEGKCESLPDIVTTTGKGNQEQQSPSSAEPLTESIEESAVQKPSHDAEKPREDENNGESTEENTTNDSSDTSGKPKEEDTLQSNAEEAKSEVESEAVKSEISSDAVSDESKTLSDANESVKAEKSQDVTDTAKSTDQTEQQNESQEKERKEENEAQQKTEDASVSDESQKVEKSSEDVDKRSEVEQNEVEKDEGKPENEEFDDEEAGDEEEDEEEMDESVGDEEEPDEDEIKSSPAYIPKHGNFYMHDVRGELKQEPEVEKVEDNDKSKSRSRSDRKWEHDLFDERQQKPKNSKELVRRYGRDIRGRTSEDRADDHNEDTEEKRENSHSTQRDTPRNAAKTDHLEAPSGDEKKGSSRDSAPNNRQRRQPLPNPRRQRQLPIEGDTRQERNIGHRQHNDVDGSSPPPRNSTRGSYRGPIRATRKPNTGNYRTIVPSKFNRTRQERPADASPSRDSTQFESRRGNRQPISYGGRTDQRGPQRYSRSNTDGQNYGQNRRVEGGRHFNRQGDRNDYAYDAAEDENLERGGASRNTGGSGKRYTAQRHAPTNSDFPSSRGGQPLRQGYDNRANGNNNRNEQMESDWNEPPASWDNSQTHSSKSSYGSSQPRSSGNFQQQSGGRVGNQMHYPQPRYPQQHMGASASGGGLRTDIPPPSYGGGAPPPRNYGGGGPNIYNGPQQGRNYGPPHPQHFQARQQAVAYPHPRQPTETVFFDAQQQQIHGQYAPPVMTAAPPPGGRVRRQLNIAPPGQHH